MAVQWQVVGSVQVSQDPVTRGTRGVVARGTACHLLACPSFRRAGAAAIAIAIAMTGTYWRWYGVCG